MSEALRLAEALEQQFPIGTAQHYLDGEAAAELRRLHAENEALKAKINQYSAAVKYPLIFNGLSGNEIEEGLLRSKYALETAKAWRAGVWWAYEKLKDKNT